MIKDRFHDNIILHELVFAGLPGGLVLKRPPWVTTPNNTAESVISSVFEGHPGELFPKKFP
jgi:hypothetical protein